MKSLLEGLQVDVGIQTNTTSSAIYTPSFSMKGYHSAAAQIVVGAMSSVAKGELAAQLMGGDATTEPASMSSITNGLINLCTSSTKGTINNAHKVRITCNSSAIATGLALTIGTSTFLSNSVADATAKFFIEGLASAVAKSITTVVKTWYPKYNATYSNTGTTEVFVDLELTDIQATTTGLHVATTAQGTVAGLEVRPVKSQGLLSFDPAYLCATASSFTNFCIRVQTTGASSIPVAVNIFRDPVHAPQHIGWGHKRDLTTSVLI